LPPRFIACQNPAADDNQTMNATEIIEQFKSLPTNERAQVAKFVLEQDDSWVPDEFKEAMRDAEAGRFMDAKTAFAKWRGRGQLPVGKTVDDYLHLTRDAQLVTISTEH
jgi:predicted transcriptional regulator